MVKGKSFRKFSNLNEPRDEILFSPLFSPPPSLFSSSLLFARFAFSCLVRECSIKGFLFSPPSMVDGPHSPVANFCSIPDTELFEKEMAKRKTFDQTEHVKERKKGRMEGRREGRKKDGARIGEKKRESEKLFSRLKNPWPARNSNSTLRKSWF